ncbi:MAG TPA: hypothetical protein VIK72_06660 [Clostridiaceae bacterium]
MEETKTHGQEKVYINLGVLMWGGGSIVYSILTIFLNPNPRNYDITGILTRFILYAIIFGLCGILGGYTKWNSKVRKFDNQ